MGLFLQRRDQILWVGTFLLPVVIFLILAFKNPYSNLSLIGNFDPFPDTFHYVVPARNVISTGHFAVDRSGPGLVKDQSLTAAISVPPVYGISLIPGYLINSDPRTYYLINLSWAVAGILLFVAICKRLSRNWWITTAASVIYVTSYAVCWQPQLAMAENAAMPLMVACLYFWLQPYALKRLFWVVFFSFLLFGSKFVLFPAMVGWWLVVAARIFYHHQRRFRESALTLLKVFGVFVLMLLILFGQRLWGVATSQLHAVPAANQVIWFSPQYLAQSGVAYTRMLLGQRVTHFWSDHELVPIGFFGVAVVWSLWSLVKKRGRLLAISFLVVTLCQLAFLSLIEMIQVRYLYALLPMIYLVCVAAATAFWQWLKGVAPGWRGIILGFGLLAILAGWIFYARFPEMKLQFLVNYKGGEVSWWRVGILEVDDVMKDTPDAYLITALPPFLWDMYQTGNYHVLPLADHNYFSQENIWAIAKPTTQSWQQTVDQLIQAGQPVHITSTGFTGEDWKAFEWYKNNFTLEKIFSGCNDACVVWRVVEPI